MTKQQALEDALLLRQILLLRVANGQVYDVYTQASELVKTLRQVVSGYKQLSEMGKLEINRKIKEINAIVDIQLPNLTPIAELEVNYFANQIDQPTEEPTNIELIAGTILISGATIGNRVKHILSNAAFDTEAVIRGLASQGASNDEIIKAIVGDMRTGVKGSEPFKRIMRDVSTEIRTGVMAIASQAREEFVKANPELFNSAVHNSVLDSRTSDECRFRDGLSWRLPDYTPIGHNTPFKQTPLHRNCRSLITYVLSGQPATFTQRSSFDDFLNRQDDAVLANLLGASNVEAYRSGRRTLTQLIDNKNNTLSIDDLSDSL